MADTWDRKIEDVWFEHVEERLREHLCVTEDLPTRWSRIPYQLAEVLSEIIPAPPSSFIADSIATTIGLLVGSWKEYVERFSTKIPPDHFLNYLRSRPKLEDFLEVFGWSEATLSNHSSLALTDLQERICRGEGGTANEYLLRFGVAIRQPEFSCVVFVQDLDNRAFSSGQTFPVYGSFVIGRQSKQNGDPEPIRFLESPSGNRLVIAGRNQTADCSREQILVSLLTPNHIYVKNVSDVISVKLDLSADHSSGSKGNRHTPDFVPERSNKATLGCGKAMVLPMPFAIMLPTKVLHWSKR